MKRTKRPLAALMILLACVVSFDEGLAQAPSTIPQGVPSDFSNLNPAVVRSIAQAAASDINNIIGMHTATSMASCPSSPVVGEDCLVLGPPATWFKYYSSGWQIIGTFTPGFAPSSNGFSVGNGPSNGIFWKDAAGVNDALIYETSGNNFIAQVGLTGLFGVTDQNQNFLFSVNGPPAQSQGGTTNGNNFTFSSNICSIADENFSVSGTPTATEQPGFDYTVGATTAHIRYTVQPGDTNANIAAGIIAAIKTNSTMASIINGICPNGNYYNGTATAVLDSPGASSGNFDVIYTADPNKAGNSWAAINTAHTTVTVIPFSTFGGQPGMIWQSFIPGRDAVAADSIYVGSYIFQDNTGASATYLTDLIEVLSPTAGATTFQRTWVGGGCGFNWSISASAQATFAAGPCDLGLGANGTAGNNVNIFSGSAGAIRLSPGTNGVQITNNLPLYFLNASGSHDSSIRESLSGNIFELQIGTANNAMQFLDSASNPMWSFVDVSGNPASDFTQNLSTEDATALNVASMIFKGGVAITKQLRVGSTITGPNLVTTAAAPTVASGQIGYGSTTAASSSCGSLSGAAGCVVINVAGTVHYLPYY